MEWMHAPRVRCKRGLTSGSCSADVRRPTTTTTSISTPTPRDIAMPTSKPTSPAPSLDSDDDCMKIVVTGASGVLGQGVVELALRATRHQLILVDRKPPPAGSVLDNPRIEYVTAELKSYTSFLEVLTSKRVDALIHLAAYPNPFLAHASETHVTNVTLSFNALQAAKEAGIRQVVMASRSVVVADCFPRRGIK